MSERANEISRRKLLTGAGKAAAVAAAASAVGLAEIGNPALAASETASGQVGVASGGRNAFEYVGQVDQDGDNLTSYGFLSTIAGLAVSKLFTGTPHDETTARFTYYGQATLFARVESNGLFIIDAKGWIRYHFDPNAGANFSDPSSFQAGKLIAKDVATFHDVMSVPSPNSGLPYLTAALERQLATTFELGGVLHRFGRVGLLARTTATGTSMRTDPKPKSKLFLGGDAVITGQL